MEEITYVEISLVEDFENNAHAFEILGFIDEDTNPIVLGGNVIGYDDADNVSFVFDGTYLVFNMSPRHTFDLLPNCKFIYFPIENFYNLSGYGKKQFGFYRLDDNDRSIILMDMAYRDFSTMLDDTGFSSDDLKATSLYQLARSTDTGLPSLDGDCNSYPDGSSVVLFGRTYSVTRSYFVSADDANSIIAYDLTDADSNKISAVHTFLTPAPVV